jgi:hypothetical protein
LTYQGYHTSIVQRGITIGFILFVISEVFFFLSIFWAFFHSSLAPSIELGAVWPPVGVTALNPSLLITLGFITPTPILFYYPNLIEYEPNENPTKFSMAIWAKDALYGLLLARGSSIRVNPVNKHGGNANAWFIFRDKNKEFSSWILSLYAPWCSEYFIKEGLVKEGEGEVYNWTTRSFPFLLDMYNEIYIDGKRVIPQYVFSNMSPSMLAFLAMQNAYTHGLGIRINIGLFSLEDRAKLALSITKNLHLEVRVSGGKLYIPNRTAFINIIKPYFHHTQLYRLGL